MTLKNKTPAKKDIEGVQLEYHDDCGVCHVTFLSDEIKDLIRSNLSTICHGSYVSDFEDEPLYTYETTLQSFLERYNSKGETTKIGMIGEFLSHVLMTELMPDFSVVSAFFNLEEKSIKKGFDLLLYKSSDKTIWITEVKSGKLHKDKNQSQTTQDLLRTAKADLLERLNSQEITHWFNALHNVRSTLHDKKDYKDVLLQILRGYGSATAKKKAASTDKSVILVATLFEPFEEKITIDVAASYSKSLAKDNPFSKVFVFCMQKATYTRVAEFLEAEALGIADLGTAA